MTRGTDRPADRSGAIATTAASPLIELLRRAAAGEVRADPAGRELYAADASLYRRLPVAALRAVHEEDLDAALAACRETGTALTMRGAGTSLAGQSVGPGLVVDGSALGGCEIDPDARLARVGPGVVLADLNRAAARHGLMFGPDVATASRATLGGMIANNSAGARSIVHGLTADHVRALDVILADGTRATLRRGSPPPARLADCVPLAAAARPPTLLRRVSGYALDALAGPEPDWPRVVCGSEGTLAVIRRAELRLVPRPAARGLTLVGFPSVDAALEAVPALLEDDPSALELLERELLDPANRPPAVRRLLGAAADADAALMIEHSGPLEVVEQRQARLRGPLTRVPPERQEAIWEVRRSGIARALRRSEGVSGDPRPLPFIEDPAVPPERLASFARALRALLDREGVPAVWYGHASVGCLHVRPLMDLRRPGAVARMRRIAESTADLVAAHGGSLSGEHGDGRLRGELLGRMYPPATVAAFAELKRRLDPGAILNPGVIVAAERLDDGLRLAASPPRRARRTAMSFAREGGLARAGEACNGNGACRATAGVMCPSYQVLRDERHSTRGRAVLLRAALEGRLPGGLADDGLHEALELCLGCKACAAECPAQVDMARLKVEALAHRHRARGTPWRARLLGRAHALLAVGSRTAPVSGLVGQLLGGALGRRPPRPARPWRPPRPSESGAPLALLADTFTRYLEPEVGDAAVAILAAGGARVEVVDAGCCGRPLLSQGLVAPARRAARRALDRLAPHAVAGRSIVVLEPSCWSMLRDDVPELLPGDPRAPWVAEAVVGFERAALEHPAELSAGPPARVVTHAHCHQRALGAGADVGRLLQRVPGLEVRDSGAGCCGMAGAFGYAHPGLSRAIAADRLLPAVAAADVVVAAGVSCRHQVRELAGARTCHPAELLAERLP